MILSLYGGLFYITDLVSGVEWKNESHIDVILGMIRARLAHLQLYKDVLLEQCLVFFFDAVSIPGFLQKAYSEANASVDFYPFCLATLCFPLSFSANKIQNFLESSSWPIVFFRICWVPKNQFLAKSIFVAAATIFVWLACVIVYYSFKHFLASEKKIKDNEPKQPTEKAISCDLPSSFYTISGGKQSFSCDHFVDISNLRNCFSLTLSEVLQKQMTLASSVANASFSDCLLVCFQKIKQDCSDSLSLALKARSTLGTEQMVLAAYQVAGFTSMASITSVASALLSSDNCHVLIFSCFLLNEKNRSVLDVFYSWNSEKIATKRKLLLSFFAGEKFFVVEVIVLGITADFINYPNIIISCCLLGKMKS